MICLNNDREGPVNGTGVNTAPIFPVRALLQGAADGLDSRTDGRCAVI